MVNGMFWNRGSAPDFDSWEKLGNPGWGWTDLLPYFKKSENFTPPPPEIAARFPISSDLEPHGTTGPVQVSFPVYQYPVIGKSTPLPVRGRWTRDLPLMICAHRLLLPCLGEPRSPFESAT